MAGITVYQPPASDIGQPLFERRSPSVPGPVELIPNPNFVFPQRSPDSPPSSSDTARTPTRRPTSLQVLPASRPTAGHIKRRSASALPDFSFNPAGDALAPATATTPPLTPESTSPTTPSRNLGHRRGASEFIGGGERRIGTAVPMSSSPTKLDGAPAMPIPGLKPGPPGGRRGHAHRRSAAISSHDLSSILQPTNANVPRIDNTPATPIEKELKPSPFPATQPPAPAVAQLGLARNITPSHSDSDLSMQRPPSRARVGFADTVEYIRPLSTISSETESTMSTVRGHSGSNSLSSVVSGASSPSGARMGRSAINFAFDKENKFGRPSTAGAILDIKDTGKHGFGDLLGSKRPRSAILTDLPVSPSSGSPGTPRHHKKRSFFWSEQRQSDSSVSVDSSATSDPSLSAPSDSPMSSPADLTAPDLPMKAPPTPPSKSQGKKPRKVKSWATSIISRKAKRHSSKLKEIPRRGSTPTLPSQSSFHPDDLDLDLDPDLSPNFDVDDTVTIVNPTANAVPSRPKLDTNIASWKPRQMAAQEHDAMSPVIDLDAALGPFNTPTVGPVPRTHVRGFSTSRKPMHSSMASFGVMMANHRRTESAPELVPFEFRNAPTAAGSTMADVFEEEEEEEEAATSPVSAKGSSISDASPAEDEEEDESGIGIQVVEMEQPQGRPVMNWNFDDAFGKHAASTLELPAPAPTAPRARSVSPGARLRPLSREPSPVEIVEDYEEPRASNVTRSSDSTITPTIAEEAKDPEPPMHLSVPAPPQAMMPSDSLSRSSFSSPDFGRRPNSFDTPRIGTAASSITDSRSTHMGEPGPDYRCSVDDVPSLTSSRSTMTNAPHASFPYVMSRNPGDRTASVSSVQSIPSEARRKRSSIASLSRLVGSSFGERSKLSIEQRPQSEHADKPKDSKSKKSHRLSKMMQFWKHKENGRS